MPQTINDTTIYLFFLKKGQALE